MIDSLTAPPDVYDTTTVESSQDINIPDASHKEAL
jgi:hypothetical protein